MLSIRFVSGIVISIYTMLYTNYNTLVCIVLMCICNFQIEIVCVIDLHTKENLNDRVKAFDEVKTACCDLGQSKVVHIQVFINKK